MPIVRLTTTLSDTGIPDGIQKRLVDLIIKMFPKKQESHVFVMVDPGSKIVNNVLSPSGTDPLVLLEVQSMYTFKPKNVVPTRETFIDFLHEELKVPKDRILVALTDVPAEFAGIGK